jgi:DNA-binding transcriptional LysR family regulator
VLRLVDRHGTVTAAAGVLRLTPSAVSHQLRQLAREMGVALEQGPGALEEIGRAATREDGSAGTPPR